VFKNKFDQKTKNMNNEPDTGPKLKTDDNVSDLGVISFFDPIKEVNQLRVIQL